MKMHAYKYLNNKIVSEHGFAAHGYFFALSNFLSLFKRHSSRSRSSRRQNAQRNRGSRVFRNICRAVVSEISAGVVCASRYRAACRGIGSVCAVGSVCAGCSAGCCVGIICAVCDGRVGCISGGVSGCSGSAGRAGSGWGRVGSATPSSSLVGAPTWPPRPK